jgi:hypothetical protein
MTTKKLERQSERTLINEYRLNLKHFVLTSRFSNATWYENQQYRDAHPKVGCIYCSPEPIAAHISPDKIIFILEMNNDTNRIIGVGMIRNHPHCNQFSVYENDNYNRYTYMGKTRIDRTQMNHQEERIMQIFDALCFKGNKHMKRGQGLKMFPIDMLYRCSKKIDLVDSICEMFKNRIS